MTSPDQAPPDGMASDAGFEGADTARIILNWAKERGLQRLRSDRRIGIPDEGRVAEWSAILNGRGVGAPAEVFAVLDAACARADRSGEWRNWAFLTLQVQLVAEKRRISAATRSVSPSLLRFGDEDPDCEWAQAKVKIRTQISDISFSNWFECTRQVQRNGDELSVLVPDEPTRAYLMAEYEELTSRVLPPLGIGKIRFEVFSSNEDESCRSPVHA